MSRPMNDIEFGFLAIIEPVLIEHGCPKIEPQKVVGRYVVDFLVQDKYVVEIDGHDYHKTKDQRCRDYQRDRELMKNGFIIIRFTGTEIFLEPEKCVRELLDIIETQQNLLIEAYVVGFDARDQ